MNNFRSIHAGATVRALSLPLVVLCLSAISTGARGAYSAPAWIVATLPPYCGAQYIDGIGDDPRYRINVNDCGGGVNHFCPGLVKIAQARKSKSKWEKIELYRMAAEDMRYTLRMTANYPGCFLRPEAEARLKEIESLRKQVR